MNRKVILETERLILREMEQSDFTNLAEILQNPKVMYAYEHDFSEEDVQEWLDRQMERYRKYGFGLWAVLLKHAGVFSEETVTEKTMIGQAGLTVQPYRDTEVLEIGYLFKEQFWHHGFAREAAAACRDYAFEHLGCDKVHPIIKVDNIPSIRVAEGIGMTREDEFITSYYNGDMKHFLYSLKK
ncbi:GNAT family N-acetyltransferase [Lachnoclostridium sp. An169]|uniref:GNAT family N-acetyltransferase n=1 Tax=Lachnoclostridium sp. An169 TaxID=1965569 RepID=UPI000B3AB08D|nr:GNAT family N-acetyltransferase [Lachnoclostridium sp. An169]OUP80562.1 GNAT family N-acetyltransferase [Lachnoclostridium sp. An169]HJA64694.1 GNAT family N-acetyltransferase [Candidatus Mediterraneibacter cottocaccae]